MIAKKRNEEIIAKYGGKQQNDTGSREECR